MRARWFGCVVLGVVALGCASRPEVVVLRTQVAGAAYYDTFAQRSLPLRALHEHARASIIQIRLGAIEYDAFDDDWCERAGHLVFLGVEDNAMVAFTTRRLVDLEYPTVECEDGVGTPEYGPQRLVLGTAGEPTYALLGIGPEDTPRFPDAATALYRPLGEHDAALVYFPIANGSAFAGGGSPAPSLGIAQPTAFVRSLVEQSTHILGFEFVLLSRESYEQLRERAQSYVELAAFTSVAAIFVAAAFVVPELGLGGLGLRESGADEALHNLAQFGEVNGLWADAMPISLRLGGEWLLDGGALDGLGFSGKTAVRLLLARVPGPTTVEGQAIEQFLRSAVGDRRVESVAFASGAMLFEPTGKMNVNYELVRQGFAQLDVTNDAALAKFPEFIDAAQDALVSGHFGRQWQADAVYVDALRAARDRMRRR